MPPGDYAEIAAALTDGAGPGVPDQERSQQQLKNGEHVTMRIEHENIQLLFFLLLNWKSQWFYRLENNRSWEYHGNIMIMVMIMILHKIWFPWEYSGYDGNKQWFLMLYYGFIRKIRKNSLDKLERPHCDVAGMTEYGLGELSPAEAFPGLWSPNWLKCKVGGNHHVCERMKGKTLVSYGFLQTFSRPILWSALVSIDPMPLILNTSQKPSFSRGFTHIWDHIGGMGLYTGGTITNALKREIGDHCS